VGGRNIKDGRGKSMIKIYGQMFLKIIREMEMSENKAMDGVYFLAVATYYRFFYCWIKC